MIVLSDVTLRRGPQKLLSDVSISIHPGYKVGLTGANGTGKSSLFAMLRNELGQDEGTVSIPPIGWWRMLRKKHLRRLSAL